VKNSHQNNSALEPERGIEPLIYVYEGPLHYGNFRNREFAPACKRLGLRKFSFHDLRKFNATVMVSSGVDIKTAQVRLSHSDPRLTLAVYALLTDEAERKAVSAIDAVSLFVSGSSSQLEPCRGLWEDRVAT